MFYLKISIKTTVSVTNPWSNHGSTILGGVVGKGDVLWVNLP